ncbi:MAG: peptide chain release factor N(5)-glutamine methyltransferase, partial [Flavobacteriaceae bacterium]|nr:peptide chain release factor N(5)-glutamine methyltransferase [Flavobacteriaceae bacterium]
MILKEFRTYFNNLLSDTYPKTEVDTFFFLLIEEYLNLQRIDISLQPTLEIPDDKLTLLQSAIKRLQKEEPLQYITGNTEFYGLPFYVNKNVLIPRPETEELIEWVLSVVKEKRDVTSSALEKSISILDIGTGSGCILITLKKHTHNTTISAIDISKKALEVAVKNA